MFARVSTYRGKADRIEDVKWAVEQTSATVRGMAGFQKAYFLVDRATGEGLSITLWDSEQSMQGNATAANVPRGQLAQAFGATEPPGVRGYEVIGEI
jgi:heme-degrading monooxygenase HmoA